MVRIRSRISGDENAVALGGLGHRHPDVHGPRPAAGEVEEHGPLQGRAVQGIGAMLRIDVRRAQTVHHQDDCSAWLGHGPDLHIDGTGDAGNSDNNSNVSNNKEDCCLKWRKSAKREQ